MTDRIPDPGLTREEAEDLCLAYYNGDTHPDSIDRAAIPMNRIRASLASLEGQSEGDAGLSPRLVGDHEEMVDDDGDTWFHGLQWALAEVDAALVEVEGGEEREG